MVDEPKSYEHYKELWKTTIEKILKKYGKPKAYIYTKVDWETFKERIFTRNREAEIKNFASNEAYFKALLDEYNNNFIDLLREWDIEPIVIDTVKLTKEEVTNVVLVELKKKNLY